MSNDEENRSLAMPAVCLGLAVAIMAVSFSRSGPSMAKIEYHQSKSIPDPDYLSPSCANFSRLPYAPTPPPAGHWQPKGTVGFMLVSAHRLSATGFVVLGLTPVKRHSTWTTELNTQEMCLWVSFEGAAGIQGELDFHFPEEGRHAKQFIYDIVVIHCKLNKGTPRNAGGALFVNIEGVDEVLVLREEPGPREVNPPVPLPSTLTVCSTLVTQSQVGSQAPERVSEHMQWMRYLGADGFALYQGGGITPEMASALVPFVAHGLVEFVDFTALGEISVDVDDVTINDCAYRMRFKSSWVMQLALEEYPSLATTLQGVHSLPGFLSMHSGVPWISFGVFIWDVEMCININASEEWWQERLIWRSFSPICAGASNDTDPRTCPGEQGRRRLVFDPQKVALILKHRILSPQLEGVVLTPDQGQINKYQGLLSPAALICEYPVAEDHPSREWERDTRMRELVREGRLSKGIGLPTSE